MSHRSDEDQSVVLLRLIRLITWGNQDRELENQRTREPFTIDQGLDRVYGGHLLIIFRLFSYKVFQGLAGES